MYPEIQDSLQLFCAFEFFPINPNFQIKALLTSKVFTLAVSSNWARPNDHWMKSLSRIRIRPTGDVNITMSHFQHTHLLHCT